MAEGPAGPRLRGVEALPATIGGRAVVCLRDPSGIAEDVLTVSRETVAVLALMDGSRSVADLQADLHRRHGVLVPRADLDALVATLDRHLFLEGPTVERARARVTAEFRRGPMRPAAHAGRAYPDDPAALARALDETFTHPEGPGLPGPPGRRRLTGLVAPHIDYARGGPAYAWGYRALAEAAAADCVVVLGTAHAGLDGHAFAATTKPYVTPLGAVEVDREVLDAVAGRSPVDLFAAELAHRAEHSIEFQAVYLRHVVALRRRHAPGDAGPRIVPLLTSFAHECLARGRQPAATPEVAGVLDALSAAMEVVPRRYCVIAGADLAHVGPRYGDPDPVGADDLARVEREDRAMLARVEAGDAAGFFAAVAADGDRRRICGLSPIYGLLALLSGRPGRLLRYGQWPDPSGAVSFAAVAFEEPAE